MYSIKIHIAVSIFIITICIACNTEHSQKQNPDLSANEIMRKAHAQAGGEFWSSPESLVLTGYGIFYTERDTFIHETHNMYRVYESNKTEAHAANGKVKIESYRDNEAIILVSFDGQHTYDKNGKQEQSEADIRWASNFGYGVIRHAFDKGYSLDLLGTDTIKGEPTYTIEVTDPKEGKTNFDITQVTFNIVKVAFDTPRGAHHRLYSKFFKKEKYNWNQAGLVELFYNDIKSNEIIWEDFDVNVELDDEMFVLGN